MTKRVLLRQKIEPEAVQMLEQHGCEVITAADPIPEKVMLLRKDADGIILRIGSVLGRVCRELFAMKVIAFDPYLPKTVKSTHDGKTSRVELAELLSSSDIVSIHVPLTDSTQNLLNLPRLKSMKPGAILINTSRGGIVDETALAQVLKAGRLASAGLDVFLSEPVPMDNPLLELDNVILTPHSAALTRECVVRMAVEAAQCVLEVFSDKRPLNVSNEAVFEHDRCIH